MRRATCHRPRLGTAKNDEISSKTIPIHYNDYSTRDISLVLSIIFGPLYPDSVCVQTTPLIFRRELLFLLSEILLL